MKWFSVAIYTIEGTEKDAAMASNFLSELEMNLLCKDLSKLEKVQACCSSCFSSL